MTPKKKHTKKRTTTLGLRKSSVGIPTRLVAARLLKGWSQQQAADRIGVPVLSLRLIETGEALGMLEELLVRVADVYGTSLDYIYGRSESAIERFVSANPDVQGSILNGIMSGLARLTQRAEALQYVDELVTMTANELPDWPALQNFRDLPGPQRTALLSQLAHTIARLVHDRDALKYVTAIVLQYSQSAGAEQAPPTPTYSIERNQQALSHNVSALERVFGRTDPKRTQLTPSRFKVDDEVKPEVKPTPKKKAKKKVTVTKNQKKTSGKASVKKPAKKK